MPRQTPLNWFGILWNMKMDISIGPSKSTDSEIVPVVTRPQPTGSRCIECNFFQQPEDDVYYCRALYFGHDGKYVHKMILDGQEQSKPKELSELAGKVPFANLNGERFVDQHHQQLVVSDLHCYVREVKKNCRW